MSGGQIRDGIVRSRCLFTPGFSHITPGNTMFRGISLDGAGTSPIVNKRRGLLSRSILNWSSPTWTDITGASDSSAYQIHVVDHSTSIRTTVASVVIHLTVVLSIIKNIRSQSIHS